MSIEEKEKAYNEALEQAKKELAACGSMDCDAARLIFRLFPQLRESENERIRKWLIDYFSSIKETVWIHRDITCEQILEWLKKQEGNQYFVGYAKGYLEGQLIPKQKEQKPAWGDEDEKMRNLAIEWAETMSGQFSFVDMDSTDFRKIITWLKSLRPSWKPSEEQMEALQRAIDACESEWAYQDDELRSLLNDLKKL